ncbi:PAAR domain-containing protein [Morganella morganii]|uniref:PAAR domain-containing protein n=1 Tax=Morganella morganii TaxID=582 RepID=UPI00277D0516|nr:PAAR domain-containing protein [Morganella morganii subsp. morganii]HDU8493898.1 PAAR domain-containing protein [Morganella morganii]
MPSVILIGDIGTGHDSHKPTKVISGSGTVKADDKAIARLGDSLESHGNHSRTIVSSSGSVFIDGKPAARNGDKINCGGVLTGKSTVRVG